MSRDHIIGAVVGATLGVAMLVGRPALAYFTDQHKASGSLTVRSEPTVEIEERYIDGAKHIVVGNDDDSDVAVFVRARVFASKDLKLDISWDGDGWSGPVDGWYEFGESVGVGSETSEFVVAMPQLVVRPATDAFDDLTVGTTYNVVVVYESVPVQYDESGSPYADWSLVDESVG